jgi:hypothetical protein
VVVRVLEHVRTASTYDDGEAIFRLLIDPVRQGNLVTVDFAGVRSVPSAFVNSAFVRLLEHVPFEQIQKTLRIENSTRQINTLIRSRFEFVTERPRSDRDGDR